MENQSKLDVAAGVAILLMFLGAFILPVSSLGLALIAGGAAVMLFLMLLVVREKR